MAGQVALAMLVLVSAGLLTQSLARLSGVDPGFRADHLLTARLSLPESKYAKDEQIRGFYERLLPNVAALPGVEGVASTSALPLTNGGNRYRFGVEGAPPPEPGRFPVAPVETVSPNYLELMRIPLLAGRYLNDRDIDQNPVVINETLAARFFPGQNAVGHRLLIGVAGAKPTPLPIVGVVADTRDLGLTALAEPEVYFAGFGSSLVVRTAKDPMKLAGALRREVMAVDREQPVTAVRTMDEIVDQALAGRRFSVQLIGLFAALALALAAIGLYGVVSYSVAHRTQEMGLRMALGATKWNVIGMVLGEGLKLTLAGLTVGAAAAMLATRFLKSQLYGITPDDPRTFLIAAVTLLVVAMAGTYLPARRATQVDPAVALRAE